MNYKILPSSELMPAHKHQIHTNPIKTTQQAEYRPPALVPRSWPAVR